MTPFTFLMLRSCHYFFIILHSDDFEGEPTIRPTIWNSQTADNEPTETVLQPTFEPIIQNSVTTSIGQPSSSSASLVHNSVIDIDIPLKQGNIHSAIVCR